jgi:hypothetical protein
MGRGELERSKLGSRFLGGVGMAGAPNAADPSNE